MNHAEQMSPARSTMLTIFLIVFGLEMIGGVYVGYFKDLRMVDAFARTANAFYVLFVDPPRFASIGLIWNPLPSITQLPFVVLAGIWKPLVTHGIAAAVATSLFAAGSAVILFRTFCRFNIDKKFIAILLTLYLSHPFIFYYGFNGMSEGFFFFFMIYAVSYMTLWISEGSPDYIIHMAFALALAFFCRYEAIPLAAALGIGVLIVIFFSPREKKFIPVNDRKEKYFYAEGTALILYTPFVFSIFLWILFNWVISGNPLYFANSSYSNSSYQTISPMSTTAPWESLVYAAGKLTSFIPLFIGIVAVRIMNRSLFKYDFYVLLSLVLAMLGFHYAMLITGSSWGWLRFFSYVLPIAFAWLPYELAQPAKDQFSRKLAPIILIVSLTISWGAACNVLADPQKSLEEHSLNNTTDESRRIAGYINDNLVDSKLLTDSFATGEILVNLNSMSNVITSASLDFSDIIENPRKYEIEYILLTDPQLRTGALDALNQQYPGLYSGQEDWCAQEKVFESFKLFKVIY